jgi:hypothetical protein
MTSPRYVLILLVLVVSTLSGTVSGHSPVDPRGGDTLDTATPVEDPTKSWAIYGHLDGPGDTWYFRLELEAGDVLYLSLLSPEEGFVPDLVVMGPDWERVGNLTVDVEVPEGYGWVHVPGEGTEADFEPFTPGSYYHVARYDRQQFVAGTYYVAVHSTEGDGPFSLAVGQRESFTAVEWLTLPSSIVGIYRWEGQGWGVILAPAVAVIAVIIAVLSLRLRRGGRSLSVFQLVSAASGLAIWGWAAIVIAQATMALAKGGLDGAAVVSYGFAIISMVIGWMALRPAFEGVVVPGSTDRLGLVIVAVLAAVLYSGFYVGPVLALAAALLPASVAGTVPGSGVRGELEPAAPGS